MNWGRSLQIHEEHVLFSATAAAAAAALGACSTRRGEAVRNGRQRFCYNSSLSLRVTTVTADCRHKKCQEEPKFPTALSGVAAVQKQFSAF